MKEMKKSKLKKIRGRVFGCFLIWLLYIIVCLTVPPIFHRQVPDVEESSNRPSPAVAQERVLSIDHNTDALLWRLRLIEAAQERVVLSTFDFRDDNSGKDMMAALLHAADRGVEVQILVDGINGTLWLTGSRNFRELAAHEQVEVRFYNPVNLLKPWTVNYRLHDKYLIADDFAYILGGRNTNDLFLGSYKENQNEDRDILVYETLPGEGTSYVQLQEYFERVWNLSCCKQVEGRAKSGKYLEEHYRRIREKYPEAFLETEWEKVTVETNGIELCTNPIEAANKQPKLWSRLVEEMKRENDILIQTPYIICSREMYQDMTELCAAGSKAEMIINAVEGGANPFGCTDYLNQKKHVRETGVQIYEYAGAQALHTKTILAGENISIVGSCNLDMRSVYLDTEIMLIIDCQELNADLRRQAEALKAESKKILPDGTAVEGEHYQPIHQNIVKKAGYGALRVLVIPFRHLL